MNSSTYQRGDSVVPKTICDDLTALSARIYEFAVSKMSLGHLATPFVPQGVPHDE